jgi:hypothetical protein
VSFQSTPLRPAINYESVAPDLGLDPVVCGHLARLWIHGSFPLLIVNRGLHAVGNLVARRVENRQSLIFIRNSRIRSCTASPTLWYRAVMGRSTEPDLPFVP